LKKIEVSLKQVRKNYLLSSSKNEQDFFSMILDEFYKYDKKTLMFIFYDFMKYTVKA